MKNTPLLFSFFILIIISCSKDETPSQNYNYIVPTKIINGNNTATISYDKNRMIFTADDNSQKTYYTYTDDLITRIETKTNYHNTTTMLTELSYENGKLKTSSINENGSLETTKKTFIHNSDNTVSYKTERINNTNGQIKLIDTGNLTFTNGNITKETKVTTDNSSNHTTLYAYDNKNNITKNILGFNKIIDNVKSSAVNNITKSNATFAGGQIYIDNYDYIYNSDGYPIKETISHNTVFQTEITQYFY